MKRKQERRTEGRKRDEAPRAPGDLAIIQDLVKKVDRGEASRERFQAKWPNTIVVHTPVHASWLPERFEAARRSVQP